MIKFTKQELDAMISIRDKMYNKCNFRDGCKDCPFEYQSLCSRGTLDDIIDEMKKNLED